MCQRNCWPGGGEYKYVMVLCLPMLPMSEERPDP